MSADENPLVLVRDPVSGTAVSDAPAAGRPPRIDRLEGIDGLRAIACMLVYFYHYKISFKLGPLFLPGSNGVEIFFVLSGYLMFKPFLDGLMGDRKPPALVSYFIRRFTRIYPPFFVALLLAVGVRPFFHRPSPRLFDLATSFLMISNLFKSVNILQLNAVFWTIVVEAQFYVVLPLVVLFVSRLLGLKGKWAAAGVVVLFLAIGPLARSFEVFLSETSLNTPGANGFRSCLAFFDLFGFGMLVVCAERVWKTKLQDMLSWRLAIGSAGLATVFATNAWNVALNGAGRHHSARLVFDLFYTSLVCLGIALLLMSIVCTKHGGPRILRLRPLVYVGHISYSVYLYHLMLRQAFVSLLSIPETAEFSRNFLTSLLFLGPTLAFSALMFYLVESPCLRIGLRYSSHLAKRREPPATPSSN